MKGLAVLRQTSLSQHISLTSLIRLSSSTARRVAAIKPTRYALHTHSQPDVLTVLHERGLIKDIAGDRQALSARLLQRQIGCYAGIDPTAPSLHLGHLLPLMLLFWLYAHGQHAVSLVGGATAQIGDPSGRLVSRARTERSTEISNAQALQKQTAQVWQRAEAYMQRHGYKKTEAWRRSLLNNADWLQQLNIVQFLKQLGHGMRIGAMLTRDTVRNKMEKGDGMSFAEFSYPLLQGWDWWHMFREHNVQVQIGGSDQYGNIVAGMEAVRCCAHSAEHHIADDSTPMGLTTPLLTTAAGEKFGKSAGNAIWLDAEMTSPFDLYGFLLRTADEDVERFLKLFTFIPLDSIAAVMQRHMQARGKREAQHLLACEVCELVHGPEEANATAQRHKLLRELDLSALLSTIHAPPTSADSDAVAQQHIKLTASAHAGTTFAKLLHSAGLASTRSEAVRMIKSGGLYVADLSSPEAAQLKFVQVTDQQPADVTSTGSKQILVLRLGKWKVRVVEFVDDNAAPL